MTASKNYALPLAFIGLMFFSLGFALGINSILIPVLQGSLHVNSMESYLLIAATFVPFLIFGYPAGLTIKHVGYKRTMAISFAIFALAFCVFVWSAKAESFGLFLLASFVSGTGNAYLQAAINPYITILGPIESAAKRISIMGICNKLAWPIPPLFITLLLGKETQLIQVSDLSLPFYIIIGAFVLLGFVSLAAPLPEVKAAGESDDTEQGGDADTQVAQYANSKTSVFQFPHLLLGCLALFFYVGVETISLGTLVDYATSLGLENAQNYAWIGPIGIAIGYICGIVFIPRYISQAQALLICAVVAILGSVAVVAVPAAYSIYCIALIALGCSLMWPALWPLAMMDLGKYTKSGSSLLIMAIFGGAVIPTLFGFLKDSFGMQQAYWLCLPCFLFILYYAIWGHKLR